MPLLCRATGMRQSLWLDRIELEEADHREKKLVSKLGYKAAESWVQGNTVVCTIKILMVAYVDERIEDSSINILH